MTEKYRVSYAPEAYRDLADKLVTVIRIFYGGRDVEHIIGEEPGGEHPTG